MKALYYNTSGDLYLEDIPLTALCEKYKTPFYVYSKSTIQKNCSEVLQHCRDYDILPCYALKANYNPALLKIILDFGFGVDVVSGGELFFARKAGIDPDKIVFAGIGKSPTEIEQAIRLNIHSINVESAAELELIRSIAEKLNKKVNIAIRVNPDINPKTHPYISTGIHSSKFGVTRDTAISLLKRVSEHTYLQVGGIHVHLGSQIDQTGPYTETAAFLLDLRNELEINNINIRFIDLGGGIGINYQNQLDIDGSSQTYINAILPELLKPFKGKNIKLLIELGRSIIGSAGFLVTRVLYDKKTPIKKFIIVDAAMNNLIRPSLYQAYHQILPLKNLHKETDIVDVVGPVCETSDFLAQDRELPKVNSGDYMVVTGAGAYGQVLSSVYNLRPKIAEYLVDGNQVNTIYPGETIETIAEKYTW